MIQIYTPEEKTLKAKALRWVRDNIGWVVITSAIVWSHKC